MFRRFNNLFKMFSTLVSHVSMLIADNYHWTKKQSLGCWECLCFSGYLAMNDPQKLQLWPAGHLLCTVNWNVKFDGISWPCLLGYFSLTRGVDWWTTRPNFLDPHWNCYFIVALIEVKMNQLSDPEKWIVRLLTHQFTSDSVVETVHLKPQMSVLLWCDIKSQQIKSNLLCGYLYFLQRVSWQT